MPQDFFWGYTRIVRKNVWNSFTINEKGFTTVGFCFYTLFWQEIAESELLIGIEKDHQ